MSSKQCNTCGEYKPLDSYELNGKGYTLHKCKQCRAIARQQLSRTKEGLIKNIYNHQVKHSKRKQHPLPEYSKQELIDELLPHKKFNRIYLDWVKSDYDKNLTPSIDRTNPMLPYTKDNITIMTWKENATKGRLDEVNGIDTKRLKPVNQLTLDGEYIRTHHSISEAARQIGKSRTGAAGNISSCCNGRYDYAYGFRWEWNRA